MEDYQLDIAGKSDQLRVIECFIAQLKQDIRIIKESIAKSVQHKEQSIRDLSVEGRHTYSFYAGAECEAILNLQREEYKLAHWISKQKEIAGDLAAISDSEEAV